jgi:DNA-binding MarR family transcriptional regulator
MPTADAEPTDRHFPAPGSSAAVRALVRATRVLESACDGISLAHYRVLAAVAEGDERASRLAARLALGKPAISVAVESLCARGLLARSGVPGDQRATCLRLTPAGAELLRRVESTMAERLEAIAASGGAPGLLAGLAALGPAVDAWRAGHR